MPLFAIHCLDKPGSQELRQATRTEHLSYLSGFDGAVAIAGPLLDLEGQPMGSLLIVDLADRRAAYQFAAQDPYSLAGLFATVSITEFRKVLPA